MYYIQRCTLGDFCERNTVCAEAFCDFLRNLDICRRSPKKLRVQPFQQQSVSRADICVVYEAHSKICVCRFREPKTGWRSRFFAPSLEMG